MIDCIEIGDRSVGRGYPCFIIAEAGVNHNGDVNLATQLVDAAVAAGADAVKFQTWVTQKLVTPDARMAQYQRRNVAKETSQFEMLKQLELDYDQFRKIKAYADRRGILFLSTPNEEGSADFLVDLGVPVFKIGSGDVTNLPFLRHVASKGKPMILSTGMAALGEVESAVRTIEEMGNRRLILLHCVSAYPAAPEDCNLRALGTLASAFGYPVGFSDHTVGIEVAIAAVAREACVLEKHITLDKTMPGPDHRASIDVAEFTAMVRAIRLTECALGDGVKCPAPTELETREVVRKSIVTARAVQAGQRLTEADLTLRRTSGGLAPAQLPILVGRHIAHDLQANCVIRLDMLR